MRQYVNRKRYTVYEPSYIPKSSQYATVYSWYQVKKLCKKWGSGCEVHAKRLVGGTRYGGLSFWNTEDVFTFCVGKE